MKKRTVQIQRTEYMTSDGKGFTDEYIAKCHEEELQLREKERKFREIPNSPANSLFSLFEMIGFDMEYIHEVSWYHFRDQDDVAIARQLFKYSRPPKEPGDYLFFDGNDSTFSSKEEVKKSLLQALAETDEMAGS